MSFHDKFGGSPGKMDQRYQWRREMPSVASTRKVSQTHAYFPENKALPKSHHLQKIVMVIDHIHSTSSMQARALNALSCSRNHSQCSHGDLHTAMHLLGLANGIGWCEVVGGWQLDNNGNLSASLRDCWRNWDTFIDLRQRTRNHEDSASNPHLAAGYTNNGTLPKLGQQHIGP
jgi:hypothetical protein